MAERRSDISGLMRLPTESPRRAHRGDLVAWMALLLAAVIYPAWWPVFLHLVPDAVDPPAERLALIGMCALFLTTAAIPRYRHHVVRLSHIALYITTFHFFSLLWRNQLAAPYVAATFVFLAAVTLSFVTLRLLIAYSLCVVALAVTVAVGVPAHDEEAVLLVAGVITAACMMTALSWRNLTMQRAARRKVSDARDFLRGVIGAIPDPVFVLDDRLRCLLVNDAMSAVRGAPTPDGEATMAPLLEMLADELPAALDADRPIEKEITLSRNGERPGTALAKLSGGRLVTGTRYLIGVIRDITERKALEQSLENKIREIEQARLKVNQLQGLLPICMHCGRIRGEGEWQDLERYIESHSGAVFSHGLCNSCLATHYP